MVCPFCQHASPQPLAACPRCGHALEPTLAAVTVEGGLSVEAAIEAEQAEEEAAERASGVAPPAGRGFDALDAYAKRLAAAGQDRAAIEQALLRYEAPVTIAKAIAYRYTETSEERRKAKNRKVLDLGIGLLWAGGGTAITIVSYNSAAPGQRYVIAGGAIVYGLYRIVRGLYF